MSIETDLNRLANAVESLVSVLKGNTTQPLKTAVVDAAPVRTEDVFEAPPVKRPQGRPRKEVVDAEPAEAAPTPTPAVAKEVISETVLREELRQLIVRYEGYGKGRGMEKAAELLAKYHAKTVSTIKPEDYNAIVEYCREDKKRHDAAATRK